MVKMRRLAEQSRNRAASCQAQALTLATGRWDLLACCLPWPPSVACMTYERKRAPTAFAAFLLDRVKPASTRWYFFRNCTGALTTATRFA